MMKTRIKLLLAGLVVMVVTAIALALFNTEPTHAQVQPGYYPNPASVSILTYSTKTNVAATITNSYSAGLTNFIDCANGKELSLSWRLKLNAAGSTAILVTMKGAVESGKPSSSETWKTWSVTPNGTTEVVATTNITVNALSGLYITAVQNDNSADITNSAFYYRVK